MKKTIEELAWEYIQSIAGTDPNTDISLFENEYNAFMAGANAVKNNVDLADVGGSAIDVYELIEKLEEASEYWRDYDNSRGYQVGLDKARMIAVEMKNGGVKLI